MRGDPMARLMAKVTIEVGGCWRWNGAHYGPGYGQIFLHGKRTGAHRVSYMVHVGPIPEGKVIDHTCNQRDCVNPQHLQAVTQRRNLELAKERRPTCTAGHPWNDRNTYLNPAGTRICRTCRCLRSRAWRAANPEMSREFCRRWKRKQITFKK